MADDVWLNLSSWQISNSKSSRYGAKIAIFGLNRVWHGCCLVRGLNVGRVSGFPVINQDGDADVLLSGQTPLRAISTRKLALSIAIRASSFIVAKTVQIIDKFPQSVEEKAFVIGDFHLTRIY